MKQPPSAEPGITPARQVQRVSRANGKPVRSAGIVRAYRASCGGVSTDRLLADPELNAAFLDACRKAGIPGAPTDWNRKLLSLRKTGALPKTGNPHTRLITQRQMDRYSFASEIALRQLSDQQVVSVDDILCDPELATEFDAIAGRLAPGYTPFEYRWGALALRKRARKMRKYASQFPNVLRSFRFRRFRDVDPDHLGRLPTDPGVYVLKSDLHATLYVGNTLNLQQRLLDMLGSENVGGLEYWCSIAQRLTISAKPIDAGRGEWHALRTHLIARHSPLLNFLGENPRAA